MGINWQQCDETVVYQSFTEPITLSFYLQVEEITIHKFSFDLGYSTCQLLLFHYRIGCDFESLFLTANSIDLNLKNSSTELPRCYNKGHQTYWEEKRNTKEKVYLFSQGCTNGWTFYICLQLISFLFTDNRIFLLST